MARIEIKSEITGTVWKVRSKPGDRVESGALLLVLEAMKMQNEIRCRAAGQVAEISVATGDAVEAGARLLRIESRPGKSA